MTTRGKYNNKYAYRRGMARGIYLMRIEFYNEMGNILHKHLSALKKDILDYKIQLAR